MQKKKPGRPAGRTPVREIHLRVSPETFERIERLAARELRSVPKQTEKLLIAALDRLEV